MTAPDANHAFQASDSNHAGSGDPHVQTGSSLNFEQSEIREFERADASAGRLIGRLLALLFFVSVVLMAGVNYWMIENAANGTDPQAPIVPGKAAPGPAHK